MKPFRGLLTFLAAVTLAACGGMSDRTYRYGDEIPLKPFVLKLVKTEYGRVDGKYVLKVTLDATNRSAVKNNLTRNRFVLRVGPTQEVVRDRNLLEALGLETISFDPGEEQMVTVPFVVASEALEQKLALIVDQQMLKDRERLTLVQVKDGDRPAHPPAEGEWRTVQSARWD